VAAGFGVRDDGSSNVSKPIGNCCGVSGQPAIDRRINYEYSAPPLHPRHPRTSPRLRQQIV
jgi:hypothetical protein